MTSDRGAARAFRANADAQASLASRSGAVDLPTTGLGTYALALAELAALSALAVVALFFNPRTARVFEPDKLAWLVVLALLATWGLVVWAVETWPAWRGFTRRPPPLTWAVAFAALAIALGVILSTVPSVSLWGAYRRGQSVWAYAAYATLFAAVGLTARRPAAMARLWRIVLAVAVPAALYALFQRFGIDSLEWDIYGTSPAERAFGPLGNPIFLGAFLAMVVPLALAALGAALVGRRGGAAGWARQAAGSLMVLTLALAGIAAAESRGPLLGLAVGLGVFALLWAAASGRRRWSLAITLGGLLMAGGVLVVGLAGDANRLGPLGALALSSSRTAQERLLLWEGLSRLAAADPIRALVGYGPETTAFTLPRYLPEALIQLTPVQFFDRTHNVLWEWWISAGVFGALTYLLLYVAAFQAGYRRLGLAPDRRAALSLAGTMLGGALAGLLLPVVLGRPPLAALGAPAGLVAGAAAHAGLAALRRMPDAATGTAGTGGRARRGERSGQRGGGPAHDLDATAWLAIGLLSALAAHLVEGALGLPTAAAELLFWTALGMLAALAGRARERANPLANPLADGLVDGLALAALLFAPILLPSIAQTWVAWPILLLVPAYWIGADLLSAPGEGAEAGPARARSRPGSAIAMRAAARLGVLLAFGSLFALLQDRTGGEIAAFGLTLAGVVLVGAASLARERPAAAASPAWRWISYASLGFLVGIGAWWLALRPELADRHIRAGQEAEAAQDRATARVQFEAAIALWPEQPAYQAYLVGVLQHDLTNTALPEAERGLAFETARAALERAWSLAPDDHYAQGLGALYRDRGDLSAETGGADPWWREAALHFEQALAVYPQSPGALFEYGGVLERMRQPDAAEAAYAEAFHLHAGNFDAAAGAMRAALAQGDVAGADAVLQAALADDPTTLRQVVDAGPAGPIDPLRIDQVRLMTLARSGDVPGARVSLDALAGTAGDDPSTIALEAWLGTLPGAE